MTTGTFSPPEAGSSLSTDRTDGSVSRQQFPQKGVGIYGGSVPSLDNMSDRGLRHSLAKRGPDLPDQRVDRPKPWRCDVRLRSAVAYKDWTSTRLSSTSHAFPTRGLVSQSVSAQYVAAASRQMPDQRDTD